MNATSQWHPAAPATAAPATKSHAPANSFRAASRSAGGSAFQSSRGASQCSSLGGGASPTCPAVRWLGRAGQAPPLYIFGGRAPDLISGAQGPHERPRPRHFGFAVFMITHCWQIEAGCSTPSRSPARTRNWPEDQWHEQEQLRLHRSAGCGLSFCCRNIVPPISSGHAEMRQEAGGTKGRAERVEHRRQVGPDRSRIQPKNGAWRIDGDECTQSAKNTGICTIIGGSLKPGWPALLVELHHRLRHLLPVFAVLSRIFSISGWRSFILLIER